MDRTLLDLERAGGDVEQLPAWSESGYTTDRPYCAVDGDLVPDMYYGRFSATNPSELQAQLDKTMMYDQYTMPDPSFLGNVTLIAGVDSGFAPTHGNGQINYGTEHYFNASHGITSNTYLYPESAGAVEGAGVGVEQRGELFGQRSGELLGVGDRHGAGVVAPDVVADADGEKFDRFPAFDHRDHVAQVFFEEIRGVDGQG